MKGYKDLEFEKAEKASCDKLQRAQEFIKEQIEAKKKELRAMEEQIKRERVNIK